MPKLTRHPSCDALLVAASIQGQAMYMYIYMASYYYLFTVISYVEELFNSCTLIDLFILILDLTLEDE